MTRPPVRPLSRQVGRQVALPPLLAPAEPTWSVTRDGDDWIVALPIGLELLTSNHRHNRWKAARITKEIRKAAATIARAGHVPPLGRVYIIGEYRPATNRVRDPGNWYPSYKAAIDGIVDAGVLVNDDSTRVEGPFPRLGAKVKGSQIALILRPLPPSGT